MAPGCRMCTHADFFQACGSDGNNVPDHNPFANQAPGWYGDHGTMHGGGNWDNEYGTWNYGTCVNGDNDGQALDTVGVEMIYRCCF